jgi:hypothetical protein
VQELKKPSLAGAELAGEDEEKQDDAEKTSAEDEEEEDEALEDEEEEEQEEPQEDAEEEPPPEVADACQTVHKRPAMAPTFVGYDPDLRLAFRTLETGRKNNKEWAVSWQLPTEAHDDDDAMFAVFGDGSTREVQGYTVADYKAHETVQHLIKKGPLWCGKAPNGEVLTLSHRADRTPLLSLKMDGKQILQVRLDALSGTELIDKELKTEDALIAMMTGIAEKFASEQLLRTGLEVARNEALKALGSSGSKAVRKRPAAAADKKDATPKDEADPNASTEKAAPNTKKPKLAPKTEKVKPAPSTKEKPAPSTKEKPAPKTEKVKPAPSTKKEKPAPNTKTEKAAASFNLGPPPCSMFDDMLDD